MIIPQRSKLCERRVRDVTVGGEVSEDYADPYGQSRITIIEAK